VETTKSLPLSRATLSMMRISCEFCVRSRKPQLLLTTSARTPPRPERVAVR